MITETLKQVLVNIENSVKFTWETHESNNTLLRYTHSQEELYKYLKEEIIYPLGIGVSVPLTNYWRDDNYFRAVGLLFYDMKTAEEKWIHISDLCWRTLLSWFYEEKVVEEKLALIQREDN